MVIETTEVISNRPLARGIYNMELIAPKIAAEARPGQFVNVLIDPQWVPLLRRPMSIASRRENRIGLIYKIMGIGSQAMAGWNAGKAVNLLGPLGNDWGTAGSTFPILVGGGVGIAPIIFLHADLEERSTKHHLLVGARSREEHHLRHEPERNITLTTDNGTTGLKGTVIDGLRVVLEQLKTADITLFGCGPRPMLEALKTFAGERDIPCRLAVEAMMGCGFGICQGCSVEMNMNVDAASAGYRQHFKLACIDGPVFWAHELA